MDFDFTQLKFLLASKNCLKLDILLIAGVKRQRDDDPKEEDSIDADFFVKISGEKEKEKTVETDAQTDKREEQPTASEQKEKQEETVVEVPTVPLIEKTEISVKKKDPVHKRSSAKRVPELNRSTDSEPEKSPDKKVQKISNRLFGKKKIGTQAKSKVDDDSDSVDIDFSTAAFKSDAPLFKDVSTLQPVEKSNLFKVRPPKNQVIRTSINQLLIFIKGCRTSL